MTSAVSTQRTISAGRLSIMALYTLRADSYRRSSGRMMSPRTRARSCSISMAPIKPLLHSWRVYTVRPAPLLVAFANCKTRPTLVLFGSLSEGRIGKSAFRKRSGKRSVVRGVSSENKAVLDGRGHRRADPLHQAVAVLRARQLEAFVQRSFA